MKSLLLVALVVLASSSLGREVGIRHFDGYQVVTIHVETEDHARVLKALYDSEEYDFWTSPRRRGPTDVMAAPAQLKGLTDHLRKHGISYDVKIQDVEKLVRHEREASMRSKGNGRIDWVAYHPYSEIENFLLNLNSPNATTTEIGRTFEGRPIYAVKISTGGAPKKAILMDANIHAREWISGATCTWIINEILSNPAKYDTLLSHLDLHFIPMINVDGYEYSRNSDRMWRKTRSVRSGTTCRGCDPNRNFAFQFGGEGTSNSPCSDIFHGGSAFSESETATVRDYVLAQEAAGVKFYAYMTFHSYSQLWLLPWGYTQGVYPPDYPEQLSLGNAAVAALTGVHGTPYEAGQGADLLYGVGGASDDWAKDHGIKYTATIEMRDQGRYGFILPPEQIIPNAQEVWAALQVVCQRVIETPAY